jgi:beta-lactamase class A
MTRPEFYESAVSSRILARAILDGGNMLREVSLRSVLTAITAMPAVAFAHPKTHSVFTELEARTGERLGVVALDTGNGKGLPYRADERISMCSTFKLKAVSAVLARVDRKQEMLRQRTIYGRKDLLDLAPVTGASV